jgi:hypothetical protein
MRILHAQGLCWSELQMNLSQRSVWKGRAECHHHRRSQVGRVFAVAVGTARTLTPKDGAHCGARRSLLVFWSVELSPGELFV